MAKRPRRMRREAAPRSRDHPFAARPVGFAQAILLHLAGDRARERGYEVDRRGALVVREAGARVRDELGLVDVCAVCPHYQGLDGLAPLDVGHADDRHLRDAGVAVEAVLDLDPRDVLAAGDDYILDRKSTRL